MTKKAAESQTAHSDAPPGSDPAVLAEGARILAEAPPPPPEGLPLTEAPKPDAGEGAPLIKWLDMKDCPRNGTPVLLRNDRGFPEECYFYGTRALKDGKWQQTGWFTRRFGERKAIDFEPKGFIFVQ